MLVDPETWREDAEAGPYPVLIAKRSSYCPHCLITILPGDPITLRANDRKYSHLACAEFMDDIEANPREEFVRQLAEFRLRQCEGSGRRRQPTRKRKART